MLALRKTDPDFWTELEQPRALECEPDSSASGDDNEVVPEDDCPFSDEDIDYDELDSAVDAATLVAQVI
jgi:hypothetical protein